MSAATLAAPRKRRGRKAKDQTIRVGALCSSGGPLGVCRIFELCLTGDLLGIGDSERRGSIWVESLEDGFAVDLTFEAWFKNGWRVVDAGPGTCKCGAVRLYVGGHCCSCYMAARRYGTCECGAALNRWGTGGSRCRAGCRGEA